MISFIPDKKKYHIAQGGICLCLKLAKEKKKQQKVIAQTLPIP